MHPELPPPPFTLSMGRTNYPVRGMRIHPFRGRYRRFEPMLDGYSQLMSTNPRPGAVAAAGTGTAERLLFVLVVAIGLSAVDLHVKSVLATPLWAYHQRSDTWVAACIVTLVGAAAVTRIPSLGVAIGAALLSGGVLGNLVSARLDHDAVPDPLLIGSPYRGIAFNLADVFTLAGIVVLIGSLMVVAVRNRDRLPPPTPPERWVLRRLGLDRDRR